MPPTARWPGNRFRRRAAGLRARGIWRSARDGRFVHVINEMGCTITTFAWDAVAGKLAPIETVSALPPGVVAQPAYTAAEIRVAGHFVYATIRGHDSVSVLAADAANGPADVRPKPSRLRPGAARAGD